MIYLQGWIGLLVIIIESAATELGTEISHFQNSLPVLLEQPQLLSYFQRLNDGWWCECHKKCCSQAKKANGRLLEYLAFDIFPLHLMFLLSPLINVTLIFMSVAVHHKTCCRLLMLVKFLRFWLRMTRWLYAPVRRHAHLHLWITGLFFSHQRFTLIQDKFSYYSLMSK